MILVSRDLWGIVFRVVEETEGVLLCRHGYDTPHYAPPADGGEETADNKDCQNCKKLPSAIGHSFISIFSAELVRVEELEEEFLCAETAVNSAMTAMIIETAVVHVKILNLHSRSKTLSLRVTNALLMDSRQLTISLMVLD